MRITVIGTGFIGSILGGALARSGHEVTFGSRHPDDEVPSVSSAKVVSVADAISRSDVVIIAVPAAAVGELAEEHAEALAGKLVIDATNKMGQLVANSRASFPSTVRYVRAFNTIGGENMADPAFADGVADMFFSAPAADRSTAETIIEGVGLRPVYVGEDQERLIDALFQVWITLAHQQGRGRRLALRLLEG